MPAEDPFDLWKGISINFFNLKSLFLSKSKRSTYSSGSRGCFLYIPLFSYYSSRHTLPAMLDINSAQYKYLPYMAEEQLRTNFHIVLPFCSKPSPPLQESKPWQQPDLHLSTVSSRQCYSGWQALSICNSTRYCPINLLVRKEGSKNSNTTFDPSHAPAVLGEVCLKLSTAWVLAF